VLIDLKFTKIYRKWFVLLRIIWKILRRVNDAFNFFYLVYKSDDVAYGLELYDFRLWIFNLF